MEEGNEIDDNVPTAEGVRPRAPDDVCEGTIAVEARWTQRFPPAVQPADFWRCLTMSCSGGRLSLNRGHHTPTNCIGCYLADGSVRS